MITKAPKIDPRTPDEISDQVQNLLRVYAPAWDEVDDTGRATGISGALIGVFARFADIIIQRLNEVPQKNFLAFLDLLGATLLPPQPARVPVTFLLAAGSAADGIVPAGIQVAAPPAEGEKDPVIYETERELVVTAAQLDALFVRDPERDSEADLSSILAAAGSGERVFTGNRAVEHHLYIAHSRLLGLRQIDRLRLSFTLEADLQDSRSVLWELWNGDNWRTLPGSDSTQGLARSGDLTFRNVPLSSETEVNGVTSRWLRGRLVTPITIASEERVNMVRAAELPKVRRHSLEVHLLKNLDDGLLPEAAFTNTIPVESGKDFFPFGEKPKLNDTFSLANAEAFSLDGAQGLAAEGATVQLDIHIANSHLQPLLPAEARVRPSPDLQLAWECWDGIIWQRVGTSNAPPWLRFIELDPTPEVVNRVSLTIQGRVQRGAFVEVLAIHPTPAPSVTSVKVGADGRFAYALLPPAGLNLLKFTATIGGSNAVAWAAFFCQESGNTRTALTIGAPAQPVTTNNIALSVTGSGVNQIRVTNGNQPNTPQTGVPGQITIPLNEGRNDLLVEGFSGNTRLAAATLTISRVAVPPSPEQGTGFVDGTYALCQSGIVQLTLPSRVAATSINGIENFYVRIRLVRGDYGKDAGYQLKRPEAPEEGFTLILESFRAPMISSIKIGYEQTLADEPEAMFAYNNSIFAAVANAPQPSSPAFEPFLRVPEDHPTLYAGFSLPANRPVFPNRKISFYAAVADLKYGDQALPISPERSKRSGAPGSTVSHRFTVINSAPVQALFIFSGLGVRWPFPLSAAVIPPGGSAEAVVNVSIPAVASPGESDRGFLKIDIFPSPGLVYTAEIITFAGSEAAPDERPRLAWEYWNGLRWASVTVRDETENFTRPGVIEFLAPPDFAKRGEFGLSRYWLRVRWEKGEYPSAPRFRRLLINTTSATQAITVRNEILGSSDGSGERRYRATQTPILRGPQLQVREPEIPPAAELEVIAREEGDDPIAFVLDASGRPREIWVRWHEKQDFYESGQRSRHYVIDHLTGEVRFGDGLHGMIPPAGAGNIRLSHYRVGGGKVGNRPAGAIVQLKTTVPYVDKVTNTEAAAGGVDAEPIHSFIARAPRTIRHGNRAVTVEDYEDLATLESPEVARAKCVPLRNLIDDPLGERPAMPGEVSVIIVPNSGEARPLPSMELLSRVRIYLVEHSAASSNVSVVGPLYIRVDVALEVVLASIEGAAAIEQTIRQRLAGFLHPLTGGLSGEGWDFGRRPHRSDLYALIEAVPGVDHIRSLAIAEIEDRLGASATGRFLVYSGEHTVNLVHQEG